MNIPKHIGELLLEHDCVIIPDFGGFVCNYSSASIHIAKHRFNPPFKKISFNRNLKNNDGLLANYITQSQGISYAASTRLIGEYVKEVNNELAANKRFDLKNIGTFYLGRENTLVFEQDETINYLPDSFGFNTFYSPAIKRQSLERKIERKLTDKVIIPSEEKTEYLSGKRKIYRRFVSTAAVLLITFLAWIPFQAEVFPNLDYSNLNPFAKFQPRYKSSETVFPDTETPKENISSLLAMAKDTMRYLNIVIDGQIPIVVRLKDDVSTIVKTNRTDSKAKNSFHIVGGAFSVSENAEKFRSKLAQLGYDAIIIRKRNSSLYCVSYGKFPTREKALEALEKIRSVQNDAWFMTN